MAIDRRTVIAARSRSDSTVALSSDGFPDAAFDLESLSRGEGWSEYAKGVAWAMGADSLIGWEGVVVSSIPLGASLSSSAALELATALVFSTLSNRAWDPVPAARMAREAEVGWVGVNSGIMDQLISACGRAGRVTLLDCRDLTQTSLELPKDVRVVVLDTGTRRELRTSAYNERRQECEDAARGFGVGSLRDLSKEDLDSPPTTMSESTLNRARHIVEENQRTLDAAQAVAVEDMKELGRLITQSHVSLRDKFGVSSIALDAMVDAALASPGCLGARMTGAGFAGCAIALVEEDQLEPFVRATESRYRASTREEPTIFPCIPSEGASIQPIP
jgi:galactokinase